MNPEYWRQRHLQHGHTGWSDPLIYAFDQLERIQIIEQAVQQLHLPPGSALDFGCGTGDISRMLLERGWTVIAYDPFVPPALQDPKATCVQSFDALKNLSARVDLVVSITVLDHILDPQEIAVTLALIRGMLNEHGHFTMIEYALDDDEGSSDSIARNSYQAFRTMSEWEKLLTAARLKVVSTTPAPHPLLNPSQAYREYSRSLPIRALARLHRHPRLRRHFLPLASFVADRCLKRKARNELDFGAANRSPLKLIHCTPLS